MNTLAQDAADLRDIKQMAADTDKRAKELKAQAASLEMQLFERFETEGVGGIKVNGTLFTPTATTYAQVQDAAAFVEWAKEHAPELVEEKPRKTEGVLNELVREHLDDGKPLPQGLGFYVKQYVSQRTT